MANELRNRIHCISRVASKRRDTIPKPVGLGSYGCQVASVSSVLQVNIEHLSSDRQEGVGL